ncbi:MAG: methylated-DNA--[protein]-cysteine S-methyltransferase [Candidatus Dormibacteria bacterium]|jgi:methylated-DNA-[protein]-cysteine S-methyltransferase
MTYDSATLPTPAGAAFTVLVRDGAVVAAGFTADPERLRARLGDDDAEIRPRHEVGEVSSALRAYFAGTDLEAVTALPVSAEGGPAMRRLWAALRRIPAGETRSYAELGGGARFARLAGNACARNPIALIVPCHRVVRGDGALGGFAWGLPVKRWLLDHEAAAAAR